MFQSKQPRISHRCCWDLTSHWIFLSQTDAHGMLCGITAHCSCILADVLRTTNRFNGSRTIVFCLLIKILHQVWEEGNYLQSCGTWTVYFNICKQTWHWSATNPNTGQLLPCQTVCVIFSLHHSVNSKAAKFNHAVFAVHYFSKSQITTVLHYTFN